mgnify:CR=1 FL=1|jgi:hypothetical protein
MIGEKVKAPSLRQLIVMTDGLEERERVCLAEKRIVEFLTFINAGSGATVHKTANDLAVLKSLFELYLFLGEEQKQEIKYEYNKRLSQIYMRKA